MEKSCAQKYNIIVGKEITRETSEGIDVNKIVTLELAAAQKNKIYCSAEKK